MTVVLNTLVTMTLVSHVEKQQKLVYRIFTRKFSVSSLQCHDLLTLWARSKHFEVLIKALVALSPTYMQLSCRGHVSVVYNKDASMRTHIIVLHNARLRLTTRLNCSVNSLVSNVNCIWHLTMYMCFISTASFLFLLVYIVVVFLHGCVRVCVWAFAWPN